MSDTPRKKPLPGAVFAAVGDDRRALVPALVQVRRHLVAVLARDERSHLDVRSILLPTLIFGSRSLIAATRSPATSPIATTCETAT